MNYCSESGPDDAISATASTSLAAALASARDPVALLTDLLDHRFDRPPLPKPKLQPPQLTPQAYIEQLEEELARAKSDFGLLWNQYLRVLEMLLDWEDGPHQPPGQQADQESITMSTTTDKVQAKQVGLDSLEQVRQSATAAVGQPHTLVLPTTADPCTGTTLANTSTAAVSPSPGLRTRPRPTTTTSTTTGTSATATATATTLMVAPERRIDWKLREDFLYPFAKRMHPRHPALWSRSRNYHPFGFSKGEIEYLREAVWGQGPLVSAEGADGVGGGRRRRRRRWRERE